MKNTLLTVALFLWAGTFLSDIAPWAPYAFCATALLALFRRTLLWIALCAFCLGAIRLPPKEHLLPIAQATTLTLLDSPELLEPEAPWVQSGPVGQRTLAFDHTSQATWWLYGDHHDAPGTTVHAEGVQRDWPPPSWEGDVLSRAHSAAASFHAAIIEPGVVPQTFSVALHLATLRAGIAVVRQAIGERLHKRTGEGDAGALCAAILIGNRSHLRRYHYDTLAASGLVHILSVSGFHIAWVAWLCRRALLTILAPLVFFLGFDARKVSALGAALVAVTYAVLSGAELPALRSAAMWAVPLLASCAGRRSEAPTVFALVLMVTVLLQPQLAITPGAIFSFFSVLVLLSWSTHRREWRGQSLWVAVVASAASLPWSAYFFASAPWAGFVFNLIAAPFAAVLVGLGSLGILGLDPPPVAAVLEACATALLFIAQAAPTWTVAPLALSRLEALLASLWLLSLISPQARVLRRPIAGLFSLLFVSPLVARAWTHEVHFLPVGQGDSAVVLRPWWKVTVIDTGGDYSGRKDPGSRVVVPFLLRHRIWSIDDLALTHAHPDHVGGAATLLDRLWVRNVRANGPTSQHPAWLSVVKRSNPVGITAEAGLDGFKLLHPLLADEPNYPELSLNDNSLVLSHGPLLLTGDIEAMGESAVDAWPRHRVLKIPHHGSDTSSSPAWLAQLKPEICVIPVGAENRFGHPSPRVLTSLQDAGCRTYRTDEDGLVSVTLGHGETCVRTYRGARSTCLQLE